MTKSIITSTEVLAIAFSDGEYIPAEAIAEADIVAATERWVTPVVGSALLEKVAQGDYAELRDYLSTAIAFHTRLMVQPRLNASTSLLGLTVGGGSSRRASDEGLRRELMRSLRTRARQALRALSEYLEQNKASYKEYNAKENILKKCCCDGGFVQIH
jgi:hypothetical protein